MAVGDYNSLVDTWIEEDKLLLIECWARDGYTMQDIANRIGITDKTLREWRKEYPEIQKAISNGKEIIDYKVENALLKSALGYKTKEVKVTTIMRYGKVVETQKEVTEKDQAPNVTACQVWLYNRCPDKWKKNRDNLIELDEEDTSIQVTVVRKGKDNKDEDDQEWQDEVNTKIEISKNQNEDSDKQIKSKKKKETKKTNKSVAKKESEDLDYWPDDWEDEE